MNEEFETTEELQAQIRELKQKEAVLLAREAEEETTAVKVEMPLARVRLKIAKNGSEVPVDGVTPGELLFLVAEHHARAGGNPVLDIAVTGKVLRDPRTERARLASKYKREKVYALFPGSEPVFPKTFRRAMDLGPTAKMPGEDSKMMFSMNLTDK